MMTRILLFLFIQSSLVASSQTDVQQSFDSLAICEQVDASSDSLFKNKLIPSTYQYAVKHALSYFPELDGKHIKFKETKISTTLNARPTLGSLLFRSKNNRRYVVRINNTEKDSMVTVNEVPFLAQIGLFGHEFCHFIDYQERDLFQVVKRLFDYTSIKKKANFEKEIDHMTIERGLGWELYEWSIFIQAKSDASEKYKAFKREIYLEPSEIVEIISNKGN